MSQVTARYLSGMTEIVELLPATTNSYEKLKSCLCFLLQNVFLLSSLSSALCPPSDMHYSGIIPSGWLWVKGIVTQHIQTDFVSLALAQLMYSCHVPLNKSMTYLLLFSGICPFILSLFQQKHPLENKCSKAITKRNVSALFMIRWPGCKFLCISFCELIMTSFYWGH